MLQSVLLRHGRAVLREFFPPMGGVQEGVPLRGLVRRPTRHVVRVRPHHLVRELHYVAPISQDPRASLLHGGQASSHGEEMGDPKGVA